MARLTIETDSPIPPNRVWALLTDFSDRRPILWPAVGKHDYVVHSLSESSADVTGGNIWLGGRAADRERYDWSKPGVVRATILESRWAQPGGNWEFRVEPYVGKSDGTRGEIRPSGFTTYEIRMEPRLTGGSHVTLRCDFTFTGKGFFGRALAFIQAWYGWKLSESAAPTLEKALRAADARRQNGFFE
jgi:hypothetical protein